MARSWETSWIPECEVAGKPSVWEMEAIQGFPWHWDKQEETVRESRYFTAFKDYKHSEQGRKWPFPL